MPRDNARYEDLALPINIMALQQHYKFWSGMHVNLKGPPTTSILLHWHLVITLRLVVSAWLLGPLLPFPPPGCSSSILL